MRERGNEEECKMCRSTKNLSKLFKTATIYHSYGFESQILNIHGMMVEIFQIGEEKNAS